MAKIITLGCKVADVHHRYAEIHGALFGASSFRLVIVALRGRRKRTYGEFAKTLDELENALEQLEAGIADPDKGEKAARAAGELESVLMEYTKTLQRCIVELRSICGNLKRDEETYRAPDGGGGSEFNRDKVRYDRLLSELERQGTKLNKLFASY